MHATRHHPSRDCSSNPFAYPFVATCPARDSIVKYLSDEFRINFVSVSPFGASWSEPKPTNRLFRLLCQPAFPPSSLRFIFPGMEREKREGCDPWIMAVQKKERKKFPDSIRSRKDSIGRSNDPSPLRERIRYVFFNKVVVAEQKRNRG